MIHDERTTAVLSRPDADSGEVMPYDIHSAEWSSSGSCAPGARAVPYDEVLRLLDEARSELLRDPDAAMHRVERANALLRGRDDPDDYSRPGVTSARGGLAGWQRTRVSKYIEAHLADAISLRDLASVAQLSTCHFARAFKKSFGKPPHGYILRKRIERACELMLSTKDPLAQIALGCGLADQSHFSRLFKKHIGQCPQAWRRESMA